VIIKAQESQWALEDEWSTTSLVAGLQTDCPWFLCARYTSYCVPGLEGGGRFEARHQMEILVSVNKMSLVE
jgi:hypothetical protein